MDGGEWVVTTMAAGRPVDNAPTPPPIAAHHDPPPPTATADHPAHTAQPQEARTSGTSNSSLTYLVALLANASTTLA